MNVIPKSFGRDVNGSSIVKFSIINHNQTSGIRLNGKKINNKKPSFGYSLQTNGNLPLTHNIKMSGRKLNELTTIEINHIANEINEFLRKYGSDKQKHLISISQ